MMLPLTACAARPEPTTTTPVVAVTAGTSHFAGSIQVSSADGATPYGPPKAGLVERIVDASVGTITERVLDEGKIRVATLTRLGDTQVFEATDVDKSFTGTLTFTGQGWDLTGWTYALTMTDGSGRIEGTAVIDAAGIRTEKFFVSPDGARQVKITENLAPITEEEYQRQLAQALAP
jgi:hypothetical protein